MHSGARSDRFRTVGTVATRHPYSGRAHGGLRRGQDHGRARRCRECRGAVSRRRRPAQRRQRREDDGGHAPHRRRSRTGGWMPWPPPCATTAPASWPVVLCAGRTSDRTCGRVHRAPSSCSCGATREVLAERLATRAGHFMTEQLLDSQLATLDDPEDDEVVIEIDAARSVESLAQEIARGVRAPPPSGRTDRRTSARERATRSVIDAVGKATGLSSRARAFETDTHRRGHVTHRCKEIHHG